MLIAAIPVKNNLKWTAPLVDSILLGDDVDEIWIYDNGSTDRTKEWVEIQQKMWNKLKYIDASKMKFHEMWNHMIKTAARINYPQSARERTQIKPETKIAILNNDIRLPHMALRIMANNMEHYTLATIDTDKSSFEPIVDVKPTPIKDWHERIGWAFMVKADFWKEIEFPIDPNFKIWWGDDYLYRTILEGGTRYIHHDRGEICKMIGIGADHGWSQSQNEYDGRYNNDTKEDEKLFYSLWP